MCCGSFGEQAGELQGTSEEYREIEIASWLVRLVRFLFTRCEESQTNE